MESYTNHISINSSGNSIYDAITSSIQAWWSTDFSGIALRENDEFEIKFGTSYKRIKVTELSSFSIKWYVIDAFIDLDSIKNKHEWKGTEIVWNFNTMNETESELSVTHIGLSKELECFEACEIGWTHYLMSIKQLIESGSGLPYGN